ncbi:hypothetical protein [Streptomyces alboniger]|nr:hypothetical protein [Streptomyces alboniger]
MRKPPVGRHLVADAVHLLGDEDGMQPGGPNLVLTPHLAGTAQPRTART